MKTFTLLLSMIFFLYLPSGAQKLASELSIDIVDEATNNITTKEHDVMVTHSDDKYVIQFNIKHGSKIQTHRASVETDKAFDKAGYTWVSKNKLAIKLFSTESSEELNLKVWSESKGSTSMEVDPAEFAKS